MSIPQARITIPRGEGELAVFQYGPAGRKPMLAIHGVTSSHLAWQWFADELPDYTIYAVDLRGRGDSRDVGGPYGMSVHADDMDAVLEHLRIEKATVIGHSMGGFVALAMLHRHPHRFERLVLVDGGPPLALPPEMTVAQVMPLILGPALKRLSMEFADINAYREYWQQNPSFDQRGWNDGLERYLEHDLRGDAGHFHASTRPECVARDSEDLWGGNECDTALRMSEHPILMLRAPRGLQNDAPGLYPEERLPVLEQEFPMLRITTVPDTNHYDLVLSADGARMCAAVIRGGNHADR